MWYILWIELCPPKKDMLKFSPPVSMNVALFGNLCRCNQVKTRSHWIMVGLHPKTIVLRGREIWRQRRSKEGSHVKTKTLEWCSYKPWNTKEDWQPPEDLRETRNTFSLWVSRKDRPWWYFYFRLLASWIVRK